MEVFEALKEPLGEALKPMIIFLLRNPKILCVLGYIQKPNSRGRSLLGFLAKPPNRPKATMKFKDVRR